MTTSRFWSLKVLYYEFDYDSFAVQNASAYQVLKQLKTDTPSHVFIKSGVLHVHLPFSLDFGTAIYDTRVNIDKDGYGLTFQTKDQRKVRVVYKGKDKDGNQIQSGVKGSPDGDIVTVDFKGVTTEETLNRLAEEHANAKMFDRCNLKETVCIMSARLKHPLTLPVQSGK